MSNILQVQLTEKQILHAWIDDPTLITEDDVFITEIAKEYQYIFLSLLEDGLDLIPEHILKRSEEYVNEASLKAILETKYQKDKISSYINEQHINNKLSFLETRILKDLTIEISKKGTKDLSIITDIYDQLGETLSSIDHKNKKYLSYKDALDLHQPVLEKRSNTKLQTSGCHFFDSLMPNIIPGLCTIAGYSGSMKTTFLMYLAKQRLVKRLPTVYVNTELAFNGWMDNSISGFLKESYYDILGISSDDQHMIDYNNIIEKYEKLKIRFSKSDKFYLYPKSSASITELKSFIISTRKKMKLTDDTVLFAFVDLMSMLDDFNDTGNGSKADAIEHGVNKINDIGLSTNTLILGTVQLKRVDPVKRIERLEDIEKFKPTLAGLKSSGAWEERSRWVLSLHNPYHIVHKTPCDPVVRSVVDPIISVISMKDTYTGKTGEEATYLFDSRTKSLKPYTPPPEDDISQV